MVEIAKEMFAEQGIKGIKVAVVESHVEPSLIIDQLHLLKPLGQMPPLTKEAVQESAIVAAMGIPPISQLWKTGRRWSCAAALAMWLFSPPIRCAGG
ncbi:MAG: hypothetical protein PHW74_12310 [Desulfobacca sp.]|nr:hypothetical protein [Desulfobacca sp.]